MERQSPSLREIDLPGYVDLVVLNNASLWLAGRIVQHRAIHIAAWILEHIVHTQTYFPHGRFTLPVTEHESRYWIE